MFVKKRRHHGNFLYCSTAILVSIVLIFITGCSRDRHIDHETYQVFLEDMMEHYAFIESGDVYFTGGPDLLTINYVVTESGDFESCFEATKTFLLSEDHLELIEPNDGQYYPIKEICIVFKTESLVCQYNAEYYKAGPDGYQDNRYWTEDNADRFETWTYSQVEVEMDTDQ